MWLMFAGAIWSGGMLAAFSTRDANLRLLASKFAYVGIVSAPVLSFHFVLHYTGFSPGMGFGISRRHWLLLWLIPGITLFFIFSYPWSRAVWREYVSDPNGFVSTSYGPWLIAVVVYCWTLTISAAVLWSGIGWSGIG